MFIASCPECGDSLTFPSGVALASRCRCPLCTEEFTLEDCLSELPPMAVVLEGGVTEGSGFSPAYGGGAALATAPRAATATRVGSATAGTRTAGRPPAKKAKGGSPLLQMAQIVIGGAVGVTLAVLIIWWGLGKDPFNLAPTVAQYAPFLVPSKFLVSPEPVLPEQNAANGENGQTPRNNRRQQGVVLDGSRFATEEEQAQTPNRGPRRTTLDPDSGELAPDEPTLDLSNDVGGGFDVLEAPAIDDFALPGIDDAAPSGTNDLPNTIPSSDEPMEESVEEGAFQLEPLSADPGSDDAFSVEPTVPANDPFAIVFPTATEDLPGLAADEAEAWQTYLAASGESADVRRELAQAHYDQLASVAQTLAGLPPAPRSSAVVKETTAALADRFDESFERRVANLHARQRLTNPDFGLAGVVVVGRVADAQAEGDQGVVRLTIEEGGSEAVRQVVAVVREMQGLPEQGSLVVAYGVQLSGTRETLPPSLADEQAPIVLAGAVAPVETEPAPVEETPAPEPAPEPSANEPAPSAPSPEAPGEPEPAPSTPDSEAPGETAPPSEEPAPAEPAPEDSPAEEPAPEAPEPVEETPAEEEPAPAAPGEES